MLCVLLFQIHVCFNDLLSILVSHGKVGHFLVLEY